MWHVAHSTFADRFGYVRWLAHLRTGESPGFADIARAIGRTGPAVSAWTVADDPPPDYRIHEPLARYFECAERWLIRDDGEPPRPELWKVWADARRADVPRLTVSSGRGDDGPIELAPTKTGAPKLPLKPAVHPLDKVQGSAKKKRGR